LPYLWFRKFLTIEQLPRITDFCIYIYVFGCRLSLVRLYDSNFGITPVDDIYNRDHFYCVLLPHSAYFIRQFLVCALFFSYCFGEIMCIRDSYVYQIGGLFFLFVKVISSPLAGIVLSVIMLRFQYSLKSSFSSMLSGVYLYYGLLSSINSASSASFWWITFATPSSLFAYSVDASCSHVTVMCWILSDSFPYLLNSSSVFGCFKIYFL